MNPELGVYTADARSACSKIIEENVLQYPPLSRMVVVSQLKTGEGYERQAQGRTA